MTHSLNRSQLGLRLICLYTLSFLFPLFSFANQVPHAQIAIFTPQISYSSTPLDWLTFFLQDQTEITLRQQKISVAPAIVSRYWEGKTMILQQLFQPLNVSSILQIRLQKVLNQISINSNLFYKADTPTANAQGELQWSTPDFFLLQTFQILEQLKIPKFQAKAIQSKYPNWQALEEFYTWKMQPPLKNWNQEIKMLESIIAKDNDIISLASLELTSMKALQYWKTKDQNLLKNLPAQVEIGQQYTQFASNNHALSAQLSYMLGKVNKAKTESVIARSKNKYNPIANAIYGLSIGIEHYEGRRFIHSAIKQFPPLIQPEYFKKHKLPQYELLSNLIKQAWSDIFNLREYLKTMYQAKQAIKQKKWSDASKLFQKALQLIPGELEPQIGIIQTLMGTKQYSDALLNLQRIEQQFLYHPTILIYQALVHEKLGSINKAKSLYQRVLVIDPKNFQALLRLSALLSFTQNFREAEAFLKTLTVVAPKSIKAWKELGKIYWLQGNHAEAKKAWQVGLRLAPRDPNLIQYIQSLDSSQTQTQKSHENSFQK